MAPVAGLAAPASDLPQRDLVAELLSDFTTALRRSRTGFGSFTGKFLDGTLPKLAGRTRDVLPLPRVWLKDLACPVEVAGARRQAIEDMLGVTGAGLNFLYFGQRCRPVPHRPTALHRSVYERLLQQLLQVTGRGNNTSWNSLIFIDFQ